jgi:hypothetical protein
MQVTSARIAFLQVRYLPLLMLVAGSLVGCPNFDDARWRDSGPCVDSAFLALRERAKTYALDSAEIRTLDSLRFNCELYVSMNRPRATAGYGVLLFGIAAAIVGGILALLAILLS